MRRWMGIGLGIVLVLGVAGCYEMEGLEDRVVALEDSLAVLKESASQLTIWADSMAVDNDDGTDPGTDDDPAYTYLQTKAICELLDEIETLHRSQVPQRGYWLTVLCPGDADPVYPPGFPPES